MTGNANRVAGWVLGGLVLVAVGVVVAALWGGCRQYPPASSRESLALMKLLYSACSARDDKRLAEVERRADELTAEGKMTAAEKEAFGKVIGKAKAGEWAAAEDAAFKMAQDQVGVGHPAPPEPTGKRAGG